MIMNSVHLELAWYWIILWPGLDVQLHLLERIIMHFIWQGPKDIIEEQVTML